MPPLSILDLAFVPEGGTPADALRNTLDLARHAERWGYRRFWLVELQQFFEPAQLGQKVQAVPGAGLKVPLWILGSSLFGAQLAGILGLPYAFASHFAPASLIPALQAYRREFKPSKQLERSYAASGVNVFAADTDKDARRLFTSAQQSFTRMVRGTRGRLPPPIDDIEAFWTPFEKDKACAMLGRSVVGSGETGVGGM